MEKGKFAARCEDADDKDEYQLQDNVINKPGTPPSTLFNAVMFSSIVAAALVIG